MLQNSQVFSSEFCEVCYNKFLAKHLPATPSGSSLYKL